MRCWLIDLGSAVKPRTEYEKDFWETGRGWALGQQKTHSPGGKWVRDGTVLIRYLVTPLSRTLISGLKPTCGLVPVIRVRAHNAQRPSDLRRAI